MRASIDLDVGDAKAIADALKPDIEAERFTVELKPAGKMITITVNAESIGELAAGVNSCLRLIRAATATQEVK